MLTTPQKLFYLLSGISRTEKVEMTPDCQAYFERQVGSKLWQMGEGEFKKLLRRIKKDLKNK